LALQIPFSVSGQKILSCRFAPPVLHSRWDPLGPSEAFPRRILSQRSERDVGSLVSCRHGLESFTPVDHTKSSFLEIAHYPLGDLGFKTIEGLAGRAGRSSHMHNEVAIGNFFDVGVEECRTKGSQYLGLIVGRQNMTRLVNSNAISHLRI
jgi:hypothetical protein